MPRPKRARPAPAQAAREASPEAAANVSSEDEHHGGATERRTSRRTRSTGTRLSMAEEKAARASTRSKNDASNRLANADVTTTTASGAGVHDEDSGSSVEVGRRDVSTPARRRDTTGLDLADDDVFGDLDDSFEDGDIPRPPMSADTTLSMSNFKSRSRQSSFIGRNDPPIRPSSRRGSVSAVGSSFNIGMFRRRAREPSILGTSRKPRPDTESSAQNSEAESDEEEFAPDAESTPLDKRRRTGHSVSQAEETKQPAGSSTRKRKSGDRLDTDDDDERPGKASRVERDAGSDQDSDSESELSSLSSSPQPPQAGGMPPRPVTPIDLDAMAAPPASSDSEDAGNAWPDIHTLAKRRRRPSVTTPVRGGDARSDISSPPSLTHSPNFTETRQAKTRGRAAQRQPSPKVTTADLTGLLPKRRHKRVRGSPDADSDDELDNSGLGQDEDELSYLDTRAARRRRGSRATSSRPGSRGGRVTGSALKAKQTPASSRPKSRAQTYSRRSSDKENESGEEEEEEDDSGFQPLPDDSFDHGTDESRKAKVADQLKEVVKKFNEVDQWELEFEEVVDSSSPNGGR